MNVKLNAKFVRVLLAEKGMTARELAIQAKIGEATIYRLLDGANFNSETLGKIARVLECNPVDLIDSQGFDSPHVDAPVANSTHA